MKQIVETVTMETRPVSATQCKRSAAVLDRLPTANRPRSTKKSNYYTPLTVPYNYCVSLAAADPRAEGRWI
jgi:hypothetical protein